MDLYETNTHPFILKVWLEESAEETGRAAVWRGHITHVPSGKRHYVQSLDDIIDFIVPYLQRMGVEVEWPEKSD